MVVSVNGSKSLEVVVVGASDVAIHNEIVGRLRVSAEEFFKVVVELGKFYAEYKMKYKVGSRPVAEKFGVSKSTVSNYIKAYANVHKLGELNITSITQMNRWLAEEEEKEKVPKPKPEPEEIVEVEVMDSKDKTGYDTAIVSTDERNTLHLEIVGLQRELTTERGRGTRAETKQEVAEKKASTSRTRVLELEEELEDSKDDVSYWMQLSGKYRDKLLELGLSDEDIRAI